MRGANFTEEEKEEQRQRSSRAEINNNTESKVHRGEGSIWWQLPVCSDKKTHCLDSCQFDDLVRRAEKNAIVKMPAPCAAGRKRREGESRGTNGRGGVPLVQLLFILVPSLHLPMVRCVSAACLLATIHTKPQASSALTTKSSFEESTSLP